MTIYWLRFGLAWQKEIVCSSATIANPGELASRLTGREPAVVDDLLRDADDLSEVARREWGKEVNTELKREREIASLALKNIVTNVDRLVKEPTTHVCHLSEIVEAAVALTERAF